MGWDWLRGEFRWFIRRPRKESGSQRMWGVDRRTGDVNLGTPPPDRRCR
jgi:hypothetical protein